MDTIREIVSKLPKDIRNQGYVRPLLVGFALYIAYYVFYAVFLAPSRSVPGPIVNKVSNIPNLLHAVPFSDRSAWIHRLHLKYGDVVQVTPEFISINDVNSIDAVYGGKLLKRNRVYRANWIDGVDHCLVYIQPEDYRPRRRLILPLFQTANLRNFESEIHHYVAILLDQLDRQQTMKGYADVFVLFRLAAFDIISGTGKLAYAEDMHMIETGNFGELVHAMHKSFTAGLLKLAPGMTLAFRSGLFPFLNRLTAARKLFVDYGKGIAEKYDPSYYEEGQKTSLIHNLMQAHKLQPEKITLRHVGAESGGFMIAGSDTTSTAMTYGLFELAKRPLVLARLREELRPVVPLHEIARSEAVENLPLFNSCLKEILRRWPTLPGPLQRETPPEGMVISNVWIPGNMGVALQPYSLHRLEHIFPDPDNFDVERFLPDRETPEMRKAFTPFSYGPRQCPGLNLAWQEMRIILATVIRRYDVRPHESTTDDSMAPHERFFVVPASMGCNLILTKVKD